MSKRRLVILILSLLLVLLICQFIILILAFQARFEELLKVYPPEPVERRRFQKIAKALGTRTTQQVGLLGGGRGFTKQLNIIGERARHYQG